MGPTLVGVLVSVLLLPVIIATGLAGQVESKKAVGCQKCNTLVSSELKGVVAIFTPSGLFKRVSIYSDFCPVCEETHPRFESEE